MMVIIASVRPTVATASGPSRPTRNTSTTAKMDSITVSSTMGTASRKMARPMEPWVKSWCEPRMASLRAAQNRWGSGVGEASGAEVGSAGKLQLHGTLRGAA